MLNATEWFAEGGWLSVYQLRFDNSNQTVAMLARKTEIGPGWKNLPQFSTGVTLHGKILVEGKIL